MSMREYCEEVFGLGKGDAKMESKSPSVLMDKIYGILVDRLHARTQKPAYASEIQEISNLIVMADSIQRYLYKLECSDAR